MYDYIFAGTGASGLSLAYRMCLNPFFHGKKILLVDRERKDRNDRTWSFWTKEAGLFDSAIQHQWKHIYFHTPNFSKKVALSPYLYKTLKGEDFYQFTLGEIRKNPLVDFLYGEIEEIRSTDQKACIRVNGKEYFSEWIFNSLPQTAPSSPKNYHLFKQHFRGWIVETAKPVFDPDAATFMDFRVAQQRGEARFMYILPFSSHQALLEYTIFSETLLHAPESYEPFIEQYIKTFLAYTDYTVLEKEYGVIPMYDVPPNLKHSERVVNIGIAGGMAKASTGYVFMNIQKQSDRMIDSLQTRHSPFYEPLAGNLRFRFYDSMLLEVMSNHKNEISEIFRMLFQKHPIKRIFRFLDEESSYWEELQIMAGMPPFTFLKALPKTLQLLS